MEKEHNVRVALAGNTASGTLKLIALAFMFIDHAGKMLFSDMTEMRMLGRIAFPLYCWCMVIGATYTRSMPKYLLRLLAAGLISQPLYMFALDHTWNEPNIFLTLMIALLGLWGIREKRWGSQFWAPALSLPLAVALGANYGWKGVLLVYLLYAARERKGAVAAVMVAFCMYWGTSSSEMSTLFHFPLRQLISLKYVGGMIAPFIRLQAMAVLALPFMLIPMKNVRMPVWLGYAIYPLHLILLYALEKIF